MLTTTLAPDLAVDRELALGLRLAALLFGLTVVSLAPILESCASMLISGVEVLLYCLYCWRRGDMNAAGGESVKDAYRAPLTVGSDPLRTPIPLSEGLLSGVEVWTAS